MSDIFWWVIFPYVTGLIMILGLIYRFAYRQLTWAAPSTEFFEKNGCGLALHCSTGELFSRFIGHIMGMVVPIEFYHALGISDHLYHFGAIYGGGLAGLMVVAGLIILLIRKIVIDPVRVHATLLISFP